MAADHRVYPFPCQSMQCGRTTCPATCPALPELEEFKAWREATAAVKPDPIWSPTFWKATR